MRRLPACTLLFCLAAALLPARPAAAQQLLPPFGSFAIETPQGPSPGHPVQLYGATSASPDWQVAQWIIPGGRLSPFTRRADGSLVSRAAEASVQITGDTLQISQTGAVLPCTLGPKPRESDLFFAPTSKRFKPLLALSDLQALIQQADVTATGSVLPDPDCKVNMGYALLAIVLVDLHTHPAQTFFYQLELSKTCHSVPGGFNCGQRYTQPFYYSRVNPFGADEYMPLLGRNFLPNGVTEHLSIDLLPRLTAIIANGPPGLDHDPAHWLVATAYYGQHIWGGVTLTSRWSNVTLTAQPVP